MALRRVTLTALLVVFITTSVSALAQVPDPPALHPASDSADLTKMSLEQLMELPVLTVVTASKREQKTTEVAAQATVVTAEDIRVYGYRTLADVLRSVPGFYTTYDRGYGYVGVRGFGRPGDFGGRTLLLLDGHRMNDPLYDTAAVLNDFIVDVDLIERVEVIRGPGSALYGNNAFFAVINVITKRAAAIGNVEASVEAGTYDTYKGRLTYGTRTGHGTEVVLSASGSRSQGNPSLYYPEHDSPESGNGVARDGDAEEANSVFGSIRRGGLTLEAAYVARDKDNPSASYGTYFGIPIQTFDRHGVLEGKYQRAIRDDLKASARIYYDWYKYEGDYAYDVAAAGEPTEIAYNRDESISESVGGEVQLNWHVSSRQEATFGAEYILGFREVMRNFDVSPRTDYLNVDRDFRSFAIYLQDEYHLLPNLAITAGLRYDNFDTFGDTVNPRLAAIYNPGDTTTLKFLYGSAFRAPNVNEFYYEDGGRTSKLNPDLEPEKVSTYEVVWEQKLGARWRGSAAGFLSSVKDLIDSTQDAGDGLYFYENVDRAEARGLEFQLEGQLATNLRGRLSYTWSKTEDQATGEQLNNSPEHLAKLNLTAPVFKGWLFAGGEVQYMSDRTTVAGLTLDDVWLVNATLFTARIKGVWDFSLSVYNLFDVSYRDPAADPDTVEQDSRTLRLKLVAHF